MCGYNTLGGACFLFYSISALGFSFLLDWSTWLSLFFFFFLYNGYLGYLKRVHKRMLDGTSELRGSGMDWFGKRQMHILTFLDQDFHMFEVLCTLDGFVSVCMVCVCLVWYGLVSTGMDLEVVHHSQ